MNSTDLRFFHAVAEAGGIGRAASALNTVQSNVTGRIRALEQALNTPLFYRETKGVTLTRAGERLLPYARQVARLLADARHAVLSDGTPRGPLRLGAMETTAALRLPKLLARYAGDYPDVDIELLTGPTEFLIEQVLERRIEAAFVSGPLDRIDLAAITVLEEELVLVAGRRYRNRNEVFGMLAGRRDARVLVFRSGCSYRLRLESLLVQRGLLHVRRMEFGTLDGIIGCVEAGLGVSLLPRVVAEPAREAGRISIHALPKATGIAETLLIHRSDSLLSAAFEGLLDLVGERPAAGSPKSGATSFDRGTR